MAETCRYTQLRPRFSTEEVDGRKVTHVILPNNSPVRSATGQPLSNKAMSTCSACLEALKLLYKVSSFARLPVACPGQVFAACVLAAWLFEM